MVICKFIGPNGVEADVAGVNQGEAGGGLPVDIPREATTRQLAQVLVQLLRRGGESWGRSDGSTELEEIRRLAGKKRKLKEVGQDVGGTVDGPSGADRWTAADESRLEALRASYARSAPARCRHEEDAEDMARAVELLQPSVTDGQDDGFAAGSILPFVFYVVDTGTEIRRSLDEALASMPEAHAEHVVRIQYFPQARFRIRPVSQCSASIPGHTEAILSVAFSPDARLVASGSGDHTVRLWDPDAQLPLATLRGHRNWVLAVAWSPDGARLASGSMDAMVRIWQVDEALAAERQQRRQRRGVGDDGHAPSTADASPNSGYALLGHKKWITALAWEPYHLRDGACERLCSSSKDGTVRVWNARTRRCERSLSGHTAAVTAVRWSGRGRIYSASQDCTILVWHPDSGERLHTVRVHGHWVNAMSLSSDYLLRCGAFAADDAPPTSPGQPRRRLTVEQARQAHEALGEERLCAGSDDYTLSVIRMPTIDDKPTADAVASDSIARMTGHQQLVNHVGFSPDGRWIASASFDKSVRIWDGHSGRFVTAFRQHVQAVYLCCWSADSRLLATASKDSTVKIFDVPHRALKRDLPGHADEVYALDWSVDGRVLATGGKDRLLKLWH